MAAASMMNDVRNTHVREGDDRGRAVDRREHPIGRDREVVLGRDDVELVAGRLQSAKQIDHRREVQRRAHETPARGGRADRRQRHHVRRRDVLVHADGAVRGADDPGDLVADLDRHLPPSFLPGAHAAGRPGLGVLGEIARRARGIAPSELLIM